MMAEDPSARPRSPRRFIMGLARVLTCVVVVGLAAETWASLVMIGSPAVRSTSSSRPVTHGLLELPLQRVASWGFDGIAWRLASSSMADAECARLMNSEAAFDASRGPRTSHSVLALLRAACVRTELAGGKVLYTRIDDDLQVRVHAMSTDGHEAVTRFVLARRVAGSGWSVAEGTPEREGVKRGFDSAPLSDATTRIATGADPAGVVLCEVFASDLPVAAWTSRARADGWRLDQVSAAGASTFAICRKGSQQFKVLLTPVGSVTSILMFSSNEEQS